MLENILRRLLLDLSSQLHCYWRCYLLDWFENNNLPGFSRHRYSIFRSSIQVGVMNKYTETLFSTPSWMRGKQMGEPERKKERKKERRGEWVPGRVSAVSFRLCLFSLPWPCFLLQFEASFIGKCSNINRWEFFNKPKLILFAFVDTQCSCECVPGCSVVNLFA